MYHAQSVPVAAMLALNSNLYPCTKIDITSLYIKHMTTVRCVLSKTKLVLEKKLKHCGSDCE